MSIRCYSNLSANKLQHMSALKLDFCDLRVLAKKPANLSGHPTQVSQYASQGLEQSPSGIPELVYATKAYSGTLSRRNLRQLWAI